MPLCLEHFAEGSGEQRTLTPFLYSSLQVGADHVLTAHFHTLGLHVGVLPLKGCIQLGDEGGFSTLEFKRYGSRIVTRFAGAFSLARLAADRLRLQLIDDVCASFRLREKCAFSTMRLRASTIHTTTPLEFSCGV